MQSAESKMDLHDDRNETYHMVSLAVGLSTMAMTVWAEPSSQAMSYRFLQSFTPAEWKLPTIW